MGKAGVPTASKPWSSLAALPLNLCANTLQSQRRVGAARTTEAEQTQALRKVLQCCSHKSWEAAALQSSWSSHLHLLCVFFHVA